MSKVEKDSTPSGEESRITLIKAMLVVVNYLSTSNVSPFHLSVILAVALNQRETEYLLTCSGIADALKIKRSVIEKEIHYLLQRRYLHEVMPRFGRHPSQFKLGSAGGAIMSRIYRIHDVEPSEKD